MRNTPESESGVLPAGSTVSAPEEPFWKPRIYADPSVFRGCEDEVEIRRKASRRLFEDFRAGRATLVTSPRITGALETAPQAVRAWLRDVPEENLEIVEASRDEERLADAYLAAAALAPDQRDDALHVAVATIADVLVLATWKQEGLKYRRRAINEVNEPLGYPQTDIQDPALVAEGDDDSPNAKEWDCVKWVRQVRAQHYAETRGMSWPEYRKWLDARRPTDPRLAALWDRKVPPESTRPRAPRSDP